MIAEDRSLTVRGTPASPGEKQPLLQVRALVKHFGGVQALKGVDLDVYPGEVHGLVGANGAGKSTLIRTLAGLHLPDAGVISLDGSPVEIANPQIASRLGLSFIHQELNLVPKFNIMQNLTLGLPKPTRLGLINWNAVRKEVAGTAERVGITYPLDTPISELSVAEKWQVSIARALVYRARLIAMDEPTASLSEEETRRLFDIIRELSRDGISILYVSHRLDEILDLCDGISVFKDGLLAMTTNASMVTKNHLVRAIVGKELVETETSAAVEISTPVVLEARGLTRGNRVKDASLALHQGEVLGLGGLVGSGRTELVRMLFGADHPDAGEILLNGKPWQPRSPSDAVEKGIGFVPEERRSQGVILDKSISFNINLPSLRSLRLIRPIPLINLTRGLQVARAISKRLTVKSDSVETPVRELSGGNQQKVVIGKWLTRDLKVLILDEPSRGVDVGARVEIHKSIRELASKGVGVIVISSEVEELPGLCDRVVVLVEGRVAGVLTGEDITKEAILQLSYAHGQETGNGHGS